MLKSGVLAGLVLAAGGLGRYIPSLQTQLVPPVAYTDSNTDDAFSHSVAGCPGANDLPSTTEPKLMFPKDTHSVLSKKQYLVSRLDLL